jgi:hypothetical protein
MIKVNGLDQNVGTDYTIVGNAITMIIPPVSTDSLVAWYRK